jgi:hypothetical protein
MIVKIQKNDLEDTLQAFVDFQFTENRGDTGPFKMGVTLGQLVNYYDQWKTDTESDSDSTSSDSDEEERKEEQGDDTSTSEDDDGGSEEDKPDKGTIRENDSETRKHPNDVQSESPRNESPKAEDKSPKKGGNSDNASLDEIDVVPGDSHKFHVEQLVYYWDSSKRINWVGVVRSIRKPHPAEGGSPIVRYWIEPEGEGNYQLPCLLVHEKDIGPLELALWDIAKKSTKRATCLPVYEPPLLPLNCVSEI